jgi:hypothetical protein
MRIKTSGIWAKDLSEVSQTWTLYIYAFHSFQDYALDPFMHSYSYRNPGGAH